jgi:hypothetical protein
VKPPGFLEFRKRAEQVWDEIPDEFRTGVDGLLVERRAEAHPSLPDIYTLGECATGETDTAAEGDAQLRSLVVLYYGSFVRLSRLDEDFDWDEELRETILHELRHHRESAAGEDALEDVDYAADQNFARREGLPFDPWFHRSGDPVAANVWDVEGELFAEVSVSAEEFAAMREVPVDVGRMRVAIPRPAELGDVHFVDVDGLPRRMMLTVVITRRRGTWETIRGVLARRKPVVLQSIATAIEGDG